MTDIRTLMFRPLDGSAPSFDYAIAAPSLEEDNGLESAVIISLFTDRRAEDDDVIPDGSNDLRGWWADAWPDIEADKIGSRLWLLHREKDTQLIINRAREYAQEALQWMLDADIASRIEVTTGYVDKVSRTVTETKTDQSMPGVLGIAIIIYRPEGTTIELGYQAFWNQS